MAIGEVSEDEKLETVTYPVRTMSSRPGKVRLKPSGLLFQFWFSVLQILIILKNAKHDFRCRILYSRKILLYLNFNTQ